MDANCSIELSHAFILGEDQLKKLLRVLSDRVGQVQVRAHCADDVVRAFSSAADVLKFENPCQKQIQRLHVTARSDDFSKHAEIDFCGSRWRGMSLTFHARDDVVERLRDDVLDIVVGLRPWYSIFHRIDFVSVAFFVYLLVMCSVLVVVGFKLVPTGNSNNNDASGSALAQLLFYGGIAVLFGFAILLNRFRDKVFPRGVFLIGQASSRFELLEKFQWGVLIAFGVSFAAGLVILVWQSIMT